MRRIFFVLALSMFALACGSPKPGEDTDTTTSSVTASDEAAFARGEYVPTPFGYVHQSCVHAAGDGDTIDHRDGTVIHPDASTTRAPAACAHRRFAKNPKNPEAEGWVAYAQWTAGSTPITQIAATFIVPHAPASTGGLSYFFPGLEPADGDVILQPVLQYGTGSSAGGGNYWAMASWDCCTAGNVFYGALHRVATGDEISGRVTGEKCTAAGVCSTWAIITDDVTNGAKGLLHARNNTSALPWAFGGVLEAYNIETCAQLPSTPITFSKIALQGTTTGTDVVALSPVWQPELTGVTPSCNYKVTPTGSSQVVLNY